MVHRDYISPVDIQIKMFDKAVTFFNPGKLFGDLTIEKLKGDDYQSRTRNKLIAEAFYLTRDIEKYGSGFIRIRRELLSYPTMQFEYEESGDGFLATLIYKQKKIYSIPSEGINGGVSGGVDEILNYIRMKPGVKTTEIAAALDIPQRTLERWIKQLRDENKNHFQGDSQNRRLLCDRRRCEWKMNLY